MMDFLYKFSFFRYAAAYNMRQYSKGFNGYGFFFVIFYVLLMSGVFLAISSTSFVALGVCFVAAIAFGASMFMAMGRSFRPNLVLLTPISGKRKCVYDFLTALYFTLIAVFMAVAVVLFFFMIGLIIGLITNAISGGGSSEEESSELATQAMGVHGGLFAAIYFIILYSGGMIGGYIKRRKYRNIYLGCFLVALVLGIVLTEQSAHDAYKLTLTTSFPMFASPFTEITYQCMNLPWLCTALWGVAAIAFLAAAVYLAWQYHKPKKY